MQLDPFQVAMSCAIVCSLSGLAALLRSGQKITLRNILSALLCTAMLGVAIGLIWYQAYPGTNVTFLIGISALAGLGGGSVVDFVVQLFTKGAPQALIGSILETISKMSGKKEE